MKKRWGIGGCACALVMLVSCGEKTTPDTLFREVVKNEVAGLTGSVVDGVYGRAAAVNPADVGMDCSLSVAVGASLQQLLEPLSEEIGYNFGWAKSVGADVSTSLKDSMAEVSVKAVLNGQDIVSADVVADAASDKVYCSIPELLKKTLLIEDGGIAEPLAEASAYSAMAAKVASLLPGASVVKGFVDDALTALLSGVSGVTESQETLSVGSVSADYKALSVTVTDDMAAAMLDSMERGVRGSANLAKLLTAAKNVSRELNGVEFDEAAMTEELIGTLKSSAAEVLAANPQVTVYTDARKTFAGVTLTIDGNSVSLKMPESKRNYAVRLTVGPQTLIKGEGTRKNGRVSADFTAAYGGQSVKFTTEDFSLGGLLGLGDWGTVSFAPTAEMLEMVSDVAGDAAATMMGMLNGATVSVTGRQDAKKGAQYTVALSDGRTPYVSVSLSTLLRKASAIKAPGQNVVAADELEESDVDVSRVVQALGKAGVPDVEDLVTEDAVARLAEGLLSGL